MNQTPPAAAPRRITIGLTVLGILVAGYLTYVELTDSEVLCKGVGGCDVVQNSRYAEIMGVPVALIGLLGYSAILSLLLIEEAASSSRLAEFSPILIFGLSLIGILYSAYLTYIEFFVIRAVCPYCVASALLMAGIFGAALIRLRQIALA